MTLCLLYSVDGDHFLMITIKYAKGGDKYYATDDNEHTMLCHRAYNFHSSAIKARKTIWLPITVPLVDV